MKNVKLIKTKTAIIILIIEIILIMFAVFMCIEKFYQKEYENFPTISVVYKGDKVIAEMLPVEYSWEYNGEIKEHKLEENLKKYEFPEENIALIGIDDVENYLLKSNVRYKTTFYTDFQYGEIKKSGGYVSTNSDADVSLSFKKGIIVPYFDKVGEYLYLTNLAYVKQGGVNYALKVIVFDETQAQIAKNYLNTSLSDNEKINELLGKITFNSVYNSCKIDEKNLILEYDHHISKDALKMNNLILFTCIPELETITYSPKNKKTIVDVIENEQLTKENEEIDQYVYTKENVNNEDLANIENLKKFIEQI